MIVAAKRGLEFKLTEEVWSRPMDTGEFFYVTATEVNLNQQRGSILMTSLI